MRILHLLVNHLSWLEIIYSGLRQGIASSMAGCRALLVQINSCFSFLQRWNWTKTPTRHHSSFRARLHPAVSLMTNFSSWCPLLPNGAGAAVWLPLGKQDPVSGRWLQKAHEQHRSYGKYSATAASSLMDARILVPLILQTRVSSCSCDSPSSAASGSLLHYPENGLVKNWGEFSSRLLSHLKSSIFQASSRE